MFNRAKKPVCLFGCKCIITTLVFTLLFTDVLHILNIKVLPPIQAVHAATGDFAVFREETGTETLASDQTPFDVRFDTNVATSSNLALASNGSDITLTDGGKYLVTYNFWAEQGTSTTGSQRRSFETYLTLDDVVSEYGRAYGFLRDSDNTLFAPSSGGTILDASAGAVLELHAARDDVNSGAGTNVRPGINGMSVLKLRDNWDYLRLRRTATSTSVNGNTTFTDVAWNTADEVDTDSFGFTATSAAITLKGSAEDHFLVTANLKLKNTALTNTRQNYEMMLTLDGVEIPGTRVTGYSRGSQNSEEQYRTTLSYTGIIAKDAIGDQTLNLELRRESSAGATTVIAPNETAIAIAALPDTGSYVRLTHDANQALGSSPTDANFNEQLEVDSTAFSHSTTTNNHLINIDSAGDYLFFSTVYSANSNNDRQPHRIDWEISGVQQEYGAHGAYVRGTQTFTGGSSAGLIFPALTTTDTVNITHYDETEAPATNNIQADRISIQGVLLNEDFFGTDVLVSATGTQIATTTVGATEVELGGTFVVQEVTDTRNLSTVRFTESGTIDGANDLENIELWYDLDTTGADGYNCSDEAYDGDETQFGVTDTNGFTGADGVSSFADSVSISTTQTFCGYIVLDTTSTAADGETIVITIADIKNDITVTDGGTVGPAGVAAPSGATTITDAELTQTHYHWRNDDGSEALATSVTGGNEDTPANNFVASTTRRLRLEVSNEGSTTSPAVQYRLEYGTKLASCEAVTVWTDVGATSGDWNIVDTANLTDGDDTTNIAELLGGVTDEAATFLVNNNAVKDTSSQTANITLDVEEFVEIEYALEPTNNVTEGATYCFRLTDAGSPIRNYNVYPEANITSDVTVTAIGTQTVLLDDPSLDNYVGGTFVITENTGVRSLTDVTITASGTVDALNSVANVELYYDTDTGTLDCSTESFSGTSTETQFGSTDSDGFSSANGTSTFTDSEILSTTQTLCLYVVLDVTASSTDGETLDISIGSPNTDVIVTFSGSVGPGTEVAINGVSTVQGPVVTQVHYHWRDDDGTEAGASSLTGGTEDTAITNVPFETTRRLRIGVSNEGALTADAAVYRLEYGTKVTTCDAVGTWNVVGAGAEPAFTMVDSANLTHGANTTNVAEADGGISDENTFLASNAGVRDTAPTTSALTLGITDQAEFEFSLEATTEAGFSTNYCFRLTDNGASIEAYTIYAELQTREQQDFFIQRGTVTITGTTTTLVAGTDYTAPSASSSAFVRITNSKYTGAGHDIDDDDNTRSPDGWSAYIEDQSDITTEFTISRPSDTAESVNTRVSWEIIEFIGVAGTDNEMIVREVNEVTYGGSNLNATGSVITSVTDDSDVVVFITGQFNPAAGTADANTGISTSFWHSTSGVPVFTRGDADAIAARVSYAVVEFTGINWKIQRVEHAYNAITAETENITAVNSITRTFLHAQKRTGDEVNGLHDMGHLVELTGMGVITFQLHDGTNPVTDPTEHDAVVWVIENTQTGTGAMSVTRTSGTILTGGAEPETNSGLPLPTTIDPDNATIHITNNSTGAGTAFPRGVLGLIITSATEYEIWVSDTGQTQDYNLEVVEWPIAEISIRQNSYRFYVDNDAVLPSDPWPVGVADLGENESITVLDEPLGEGEVVRIRTSLLINNASQPANTQSYKLQYGTRNSSCSAISVWTDVGAIGSGAIWRGHDTAATDGTAISATDPPTGGDTVLSGTDRAGTFEEANNSAVNPYKVRVGEQVEYDWVVEHNGATQKTFYCFRMVESDGSELTGYDNYPTLRTSGYSPVVVNWRWFDDETSLTPSIGLAPENTAPTDIANDNLIKLRVRVDEIDGATGNNVKFKLQYAEDSNFTTVFDVASSTTCLENSTWCYADGAGVDNAIIDNDTLTGVDSCVAGVGDGCGTHNEATSTASTFSHGALNNTEFEFTIQHAGARVNNTYYFRLFDVSNDEIVLASTTNPSLVTEGAQLTLTFSGVPAATVTEGITTDAGTSATGITFGSIPVATEVEAAHRLTVDTNATEGYRVFMFSRNELTDSYGTAIASTTGTNAVPVSWSVGCPGGTTGCFGYHAGDDTLEGSTRFSPDDTYAAFSTTPAEIMYSSIPAVSESSDVIYKIEIEEDQPAGEYETSIVYIASPVF